MDSTPMYIGIFFLFVILLEVCACVVLHNDTVKTKNCWERMMSAIGKAPYRRRVI
jgi:hypothetical protein